MKIAVKLVGVCVLAVVCVVAAVVGMWWGWARVVQEAEGQSHGAYHGDGRWTTPRSLP